MTYQKLKSIFTLHSCGKFRLRPFLTNKMFLLRIVYIHGAALVLKHHQIPLNITYIYYP